MESDPGSFSSDAGPEATATEPSTVDATETGTGEAEVMPTRSGGIGAGTSGRIASATGGGDIQGWFSLVVAIRELHSATTTGASAGRPFDGASMSPPGGGGSSPVGITWSEVPSTIILVAIAGEPPNVPNWASIVAEGPAPSGAVTPPTGLAASAETDVETGP